MTKPNPETFNAVVSAANIASISLIRSSIKFDLPEDTDVGQVDVKVQMGLIHLNIGEEFIEGIFRYSARCNTANSEIISADNTYSAVYVISSPCSEDDAKHFLNRVGKHAAYPYFRSYFAMATDQAGIAMPPLPLISDQPRNIKS